MKSKNSGQSTIISSLYIDSNSICWLNFFGSTTTGFSELISYDAATDTFKAYQQDGVAYYYQFVDASNNNYWYGIALSSNTTGALVNNMDSISLITVETSTSVGLEDSNLTISSQSLGSHDFPTKTWSTGTSNPEADLTYNVEEA